MSIPYQEFEKLPLLERLSADKGECYGCYCKEHEEAIALIKAQTEELEKLRAYKENVIKLFTGFRS